KTDNKYKSRYSSYNQPEESKLPLLEVLNQVKMLNTSLLRKFIPGNVKKKNTKNEKMKGSKNPESLIDELLQDEQSDMNVTLSFHIVKVWKKYELSQTFHTVDELAEDFVSLLRNELKQKLESTGKLGRLVGDTLKELVLNGSLDHGNFLNVGKNTFSELTKNYTIIEKNEDFVKSFLSGPAVDLRPQSVFAFPTGITSHDGLSLGLSENDKAISFPEKFSYPILLAGDKKTREIISNRLLEQNKKFIILDPRANLEFEDRIHSDFEKLTLGENFFFNVLTPVTRGNYVSEQLSSQYLGNFIEIVQSITDVRSDAAILLRDLIDFYVNEYQEEQDEILFAKHDTPVSLSDLYSMLTIEPGGLVITDFQLSNIRTIINDIRDPSIGENTRIGERVGLEEIFKSSKIIDFSSLGYKVQKLFLYSFLLQLTIYEQLEEEPEEIIIYIDDAELFFARDIERTVLLHILSKLENSPFKIIFSTPYPSQLAISIFDSTYNRVIGNLKSSKCVRLISESHSLDKNQQEFVRRLPRNNFLLVREELMEKPLILRFFEKDVDRHNSQMVKRRKSEDDLLTGKMDNSALTINAEDFSKFHPIMLEVLDKLSSKANRGINTESLAKLFPNWPENKVREAVSLLEIFGYIFYETVDKRGRKGEYWTKITPRGEKFLKKLKFSHLVVERNKKLEEETPEEEKKVTTEDVLEDIENYIEDSNVGIRNEPSEEQSLLIKKLQNIRKVVRVTRDSEDDKYTKLDTLNSLLIQIPPLFKENISEETQKLEIFLGSLDNLLKEEVSMDGIPQKVLDKIFHKALSLIDAIQIKTTYGDKSKNIQDEEFIEKVIEKELGTEKWKDFDRDIFLTEIPELSSLRRENKKLMGLLDSEIPDDIIKSLDLSDDLPQEEFSQVIKKALSSLLQIKTSFFPKMDSEEYLEQINTFFKAAGLPEPFEKSKQLDYPNPLKNHNSYFGNIQS
ncbi:MAG: hypothetical protein ACTSQF_12495, partial [Candidatus Heimdallarchaeaceae archaeon]